MGFRMKSLAALGALSLVASPVVAQADVSAARVGETTAAESEAEGGWLLAIPAVAAIILAIVLLSDSEDDSPTSP